MSMRAEFDKLKKINSSLRYKLEVLNDKLSQELYKIESESLPLPQRKQSDEGQLTTLHKKIKNYEKERSYLQKRIAQLSEPFYESTLRAKVKKLSEHLHTLQTQKRPLKSVVFESKPREKDDYEQLIKEINFYSHKNALLEESIDKINKSIQENQPKLNDSENTGKGRHRKKPNKLRMSLEIKEKEFLRTEKGLVYVTNSKYRKINVLEKELEELKITENSIEKQLQLKNKELERLLKPESLYDNVSLEFTPKLKKKRHKKVDNKTPDHMIAIAHFSKEAVPSFIH